MPFPDVERVIYNKNPLDRVICQLRFAPILKIDTEIPAEFQERIRVDYPNLSETAEWSLAADSNKREGLPDEAIKRILQSPGIRNYEFSSEDNQWKVNLTRSFVSLSTSKYRRWEEFRDRLQCPLQALLEVYSPTKFSRIGLRYIDIIVRSRLGLENVNWDELIQPHLLGIMAISDLRDSIQLFQCSYDIRLEGGKSIARVATRTVESTDSGESCFMIDSDFFSTTSTGADQALQQLDYFNERASRLIRWCITERLHKAMEPTKL